MRGDEEANEVLINGEKDVEFPSSHRRRNCLGSLLLPWLLASFFFGTTVFLALALSKKPSDEYGSYERGFKTDFVSTESPMPMRLIKKLFTNDLLFNSTSGQLYNQPLTPNETSYMGSSPAAVTAWNDLLHAQYIALSDGEAKQIPAGHIEPIWFNGEHNFMEFSVFHNLHCLNEIRMKLSTPHQDHGDEADEDWFHGNTVHLHHCIDQIRQALMCHADLTPVPMRPVEGKEDAILGNGEEHTCRDFDAIWHWVEERSKKWKSWGD